MILQGWRVEGFGRFRDEEVKDLTSGLTVIEGANEAGKSTLLAFLRFMLFGFARGEAQRYPALQGGRQGGLLYLGDSQGQWQIERIHGRPMRLTAPDGSVLGEDALQALLGRIDSAIFRDVFAFSLWELSNLEALTQVEVRDRLYSVGLTGAGRSASGARQAIEKRLDTLMRARSQEGRVNKLQASLVQVRRGLQAARLQAEDFEELQRREEAAEERVRELQREAVRLRDRQVRLRSLQSVEGIWNRLLRLEEDLGRPAKAIDTVLAEEAQQLIAGRKERADRIGEREEEERGLAARVSQLTPNEALLAVAPTVQEMAQDLTLQESLLRSLDALARSEAAKREEVRQGAERLGLPADAPAVALGYALLQEIDTWGERLRDALETVRRAEQKAEETEHAAAEAQAEARAAEAAFAPFTGTLGGANLDLRIAGIGSLQRFIERSRARRATHLLLGAVGAAMTAAGAFGVVSHVAALFASLAVGLFLLLYAVFSATGGTARKARQQAQAAAAEAGIPFTADEGELERLRRDAEMQKAGAADRDLLAQQARETGEKAAHQTDVAQAAQTALEAARVQSGEIREGFSAFKVSHGLPAAFSPDRLASYAAELQSFGRVRSELAQLEEEGIRTRRSVSEWQTRASQQLQAAGRPVEPDGEEILRAMRRLSSDVQAALNSLEQAKESSGRLEEVRARCKSMREAHEDAEERIESLFATLGARDATELQRMREAAEARAQFLDLAGTAAEEFADELRRGQPDARREDEAATAQRLREIDDMELREAVDEAGALRGQREAVAQAADVAELAAQEEQVRTELLRAVAQWRAVFAAKRLLERTLEVYERDRQPQVLRFASEALTKITSGRYVGVRQQRDAKGLLAVDAWGVQRTPDELSRGTAEQLYLALRLGLAASYGERVATLPIVLDDVLVNFDPARARAVLEVLAEFASAPGRQALLFTCHPFIRQMVEELLPQARVLQLPQPLGAGAGEAAAARHPEAEDGLPSAILAMLSLGAQPLKALAAALGRPEAQVRRGLEELVRTGRAETVGEGRGRRYRSAPREGLFEG